MKKKILALLTALTVMAMGSLTAFAASPTVGTTETPVATQNATTQVVATATPAQYAAATTAAAGFQVAAVSDTTAQAASVAVQNAILNDVAAIGTALSNSTVAKAATSGEKVTASVLSLVEVSATSATKNAAGKYVVTLNLAAVASGDAIAVLHYNGSAWETIVPSSVAAGSVTFETASLSPIAVVKLEVSSVTGSPKTGTTAPVAAMAAFIALAAAAFCGKKYFANRNL